MKTPIAAYMQKDYNAGIFVRAPTIKAEVSHIAAIVILGPIDFIASPILSGIVGAFCFLKLWVIINILSTPMARIRNGIT